MKSSAEIRRNAVLQARDIVKQQVYLGGEFVASESDKVVECIDPYTRQNILNLPIASMKQADIAVNKAEMASREDIWGGAHPRVRAQYLYKIADLIENEADLISRFEALDTGKKYSGTKAWDIPNAAEVFRYYAGWADKVFGKTVSPIYGHTAHTRLEPIGAVAVIMPWNFPFANLAWKVAPALAAGCGVVVKSAERAPLTTQYFAQIAEEIGLPQGVLSILNGSGEELGNYLVQHQKIRKVSFTGNSETGIEIIKNCANGNKSMTLEMGGKSANVVTRSCDLEAAVTGTISAMFSVSGQDCLAGSRTFVERSIFDEFCKKLVSRVKKIRLGDNFDDEIDQGPQIDEQHISVIQGFVERAKEDPSNRLICGGDVFGEQGTHFLPTVFVSEDDCSELVTEEVFGPVASLLVFDELDEAINRANASRYGLAAAIWSSNRNEIEVFQKKIEAGTVWVNTYGMIDISLPWGGVKMSGAGKELGENCLLDYLHEKTVFEAS